MIWRPSLIQLFEIVTLLRKVNALETSFQIGETVGFPDVIGQWIINVRCKILERCGYDAPQLPAGDAGDFLVNGHVAPDIERMAFISILDKLEFRIEEHDL